MTSLTAIFNFANAALPRRRPLTVILTFEINLKIIRGNYCFALKNFVPLHCQLRDVETVLIKDKNCED